VGSGEEQEAGGPEQTSRWRRMVEREEVSMVGSPSSRRGVGIKNPGSGVVGNGDRSTRFVARQAYWRTGRGFERVLLG
jgi:hypothetical protein